MTVHADSGFFAKKYNENADEEEKAAYRDCLLYTSDAADE